MKIVPSSDLLIAATHAVIALQMARTLLKRRADLTSETSVARALRDEGFGSPSIRALARKATKAARVFRDEGAGI